MKTMDRCEPSDVIWENKGLHNWKWAIVVLCIVLITVSLSVLIFSTVFVLKARS